MPDEAVASSIAEAFAEYESIENLKICLLRAEVANRELPTALEAMGAIVDDVACYRTVPETEEPGGAAAKLLESGADWVTFTSASTVEHFHAVLTCRPWSKSFLNSNSLRLARKRPKPLPA